MVPAVNDRSASDARLSPIFEQRVDLLGVINPGPTTPAVITIPSALAGFEIEAGTAADYNHLLLADGSTHE